MCPRRPLEVGQAVAFATITTHQTHDTLHTTFHTQTCIASVAATPPGIACIDMPVLEYAFCQDLSSP